MPSINTNNNRQYWLSNDTAKDMRKTDSGKANNYAANRPIKHPNNNKRNSYDLTIPSYNRENGGNSKLSNKINIDGKLY